jgi:hypothetical protein
MNVSIERTKEIRLLSAFFRVSAIDSRVHKATQDVLDDVERCFHGILLRRFCGEVVRPRTFGEYIRRPSQLVTDFRKLITAMGSQNVNVQSPFDREVFFGYLTAEFYFERFLEKRKELAKYDLMVTEYCNRSQVGLVEDTLDLK